MEGAQGIDSSLPLLSPLHKQRVANLWTENGGWRQLPMDLPTTPTPAAEEDPSPGCRTPGARLHCTRCGLTVPISVGGCFYSLLQLAHPHLRTLLKEPMSSFRRAPPSRPPLPPHPPPPPTPMLPQWSLPPPPAQTSAGQPLVKALLAAVLHSVPQAAQVNLNIPGKSSRHVVHLQRNNIKQNLL